jgi:hypothetical protein
LLITCQTRLLSILSPTTSTHNPASDISPQLPNDLLQIGSYLSYHDLHSFIPTNRQLLSGAVLQTKPTGIAFAPLPHTLGLGHRLLNIATMLLSYGCDVNYTDGLFAPLSYASTHEYAEMVKF